MDNDRDLLKETALIVSSHVANNVVTTDQVTALIREVYKTLMALGKPEVQQLNPAVPINRSVFPDHIICLEDGRKLKMLKRHLATSYNMTPDMYRQRWNLPMNYPMVAPDYAATRSALAKNIGLGKKRSYTIETSGAPMLQKRKPGRPLGSRNRAA